MKLDLLLSQCSTHQRIEKSRFLGMYMYGGLAACLIFWSVSIGFSTRFSACVGEWVSGEWSGGMVECGMLLLLMHEDLYVASLRCCVVASLLSMADWLDWVD